MTTVSSFINRLDNPNHILLAVKSDFIVLDASNEAKKGLFYPGKSIIGNRLIDIIKPVGLEAKQFLSLKKFPTEKQGPCRFYVKSAGASANNDNSLFLFTYVFPFTGKDKSTALVILSPETMKAPASHKFLTMYYNLNYPVVLLDRKDSIVLYNHHFHEMINFMEPDEFQFKSILPLIVKQDKKDNPFRRIGKSAYPKGSVICEGGEWKKMLSFDGKPLHPRPVKPMVMNSSAQLILTSRGFLMQAAEGKVNSVPTFTLPHSFNPADQDIRLVLDIIPGHASSSTIVLGQPFPKDVRTRAIQNSYHIDLEVRDKLTFYLCKRDVVLEAKTILKRGLHLSIARIGGYFRLDANGQRLIDFVDPNPIFDKRSQYFSWLLWDGKIELSHAEVFSRSTLYNPEEIDLKSPRIVEFKAAPGKLFKFSSEIVSYFKQESALFLKFEPLPMLPQKNLKSQSIILFENARKYIQANFYRKIDFEKLARQCYQCHKYFIRCFKASYGLSPLAYQTNIRLQEAKILLKSHSMSVREVGETVGFSDPIGFQRLFKKYTGITPGTFASVKQR